MPKKSKLNLPPLNLGKETIGQRLTRLRKEKGYTQKLISDYELGKLRPYYEMVARFALALMCLLMSL